MLSSSHPDTRQSDPVIVRQEKEILSDIGKRTGKTQVHIDIFFRDHFKKRATNGIIPAANNIMIRSDQKITSFIQKTVRAFFPVHLQKKTFSI